MQKRCYIILTIILSSFAVHAQRDSIKHTYVHKKRASAYDTTGVYFNKWKLNYNFNLGFLDVQPYISGYQSSPGNPGYPGTLGILSTSYNEFILPAFSYSMSYGITEKSALGISFAFQQTDFNPVTPSPGLTSGNLPLLIIEARYMHCWRSWKHFYYGFQYGEIFFQNNFNSNTFIDNPLLPHSFQQPFIGWLGGVRFQLTNNVWFNCEVQENIPLVSNLASPLIIEDFGINYSFDTHKTCHKPVKEDPVVQREKMDIIKKHNEAFKDSAKMKQMRFASAFDTSIHYTPSDLYKSKHIRSVYDTSSPFYNKGKLNLTVEFGSTDMDVVASSMFGTVNPDYNQSLQPLVSLCTDYGIGRKSDIGGSIAFGQVHYTPAFQSSTLTPGNVSLYLVEARYLHSMWSWRFFYYGVKFGVAVWQPSFNSNTFYDPPQTSQTLVQPYLSLIIGGRINLSKNIFIHLEIEAGTIVYANYGLTYKLDTRKKPSESK